MNIQVLDRQNQILFFWFGKLSEETQWDADKSKLWFSSSEELDREIQETFGEDIERAASGDYQGWENTPRGRLALILLLDQFPRNVFRGTPQAYQFDARAQKLSLEGIAHGQDQELYPIERQFFYLPLMHAESLEHQLLSLFVFQKLTQEVDPSIREHFSLTEGYAKHHFETVRTYGRFPHRNAILERVNTQEEAAYLAASSETYGQTKK
ncbi:MAG: DUF924 domain-containing protein [Chlamydiia bacterium]|nr:DUF924 domain-containing protein [Chlamydiia bacterium]